MPARLLDIVQKVEYRKLLDRTEKIRLEHGHVKAADIEPDEKAGRLEPLPEFHHIFFLVGTVCFRQIIKNTNDRNLEFRQAQGLRFTDLLE